MRSLIKYEISWITGYLFFRGDHTRIISWGRTRLDECLEKLSVVSVLFSLCKRLNVLGPFLGFKRFYLN